MPKSKNIRKSKKLNKNQAKSNRNNLHKNTIEESVNSKLLVKLFNSSNTNHLILFVKELFNIVNTQFYTNKKKWFETLKLSVENDKDLLMSCLLAVYHSRSSAEYEKHIIEASVLLTKYNLIGHSQDLIDYGEDNDIFMKYYWEAINNFISVMDLLKSAYKTGCFSSVSKQIEVERKVSDF